MKYELKRIINPKGYGWGYKAGVYKGDIQNFLARAAGTAAAAAAAAAGAAAKVMHFGSDAFWK